jgi:hypothetical protein
MCSKGTYSGVVYQRREDIDGWGLVPDSVDERVQGPGNIGWKNEQKRA